MLGVFATASWCVVVDHDRWISAAVAAIVAQDSPQIAGLGSAPARIEHGRPGLVHEQAARLLHHDAHALDQRREVEGDRSHPVRQNGAIDEDAMPGQNLRLTIERHVLAELGNRHLRQQRLGGDATLHQMGGRRRLAHAGASCRAGVARPHRLDHAILGRRHVEASGAILADPDHLAAAARTLEALGFDHLLNARQVRGKGAGGAAGPATRRCRAGAARTIVLALLDFDDGDLDVFEHQLHLIGIELLRAFAEACTLVLLHEQFETVDDLFGRS
jgi:hypothetical protein